MREVSRKIVFNNIVIEHDDESSVDIQSAIEDVIEYALTLQKKDRKLDYPSTDKFIFIDSSTSVNPTLRKGLFKTAKHGIRPNLIEQSTLTERSNPKQITEGDAIKTNFALRYKDGDAILVSEKFLNSVTARQFVEYLNFLLQKMKVDTGDQFSYRFSFCSILKDDIWEELERMDKVKVAVVTADKQLLGSDALNFSNRTTEVKSNMSIKLSALRGESIYDTVADILNGRQNSRISKVKIEGVDDDGHIIKIDTDKIEKVEWIRVQKHDDTGETNVTQTQTKLGQIASRL